MWCVCVRAFKHVSFYVFPFKYLAHIYYQVSHVTGHHRGLKWKLWPGYRAPSLQRTSYLCVGLLCCTTYATCVFHRQVWYRTLSLRYVHVMHILNVRPLFSPLGYPYTVFRFCRSFHCWVRRWRKIVYSITHSVTHSPSLFDSLGTEAFTSE